MYDVFLFDLTNIVIFETFRNTAKLIMLKVVKLSSY